MLAATIDCLVERGYANTSTRHIAARAGVTLGALQHHFSGKADADGGGGEDSWRSNGR